MATRTLTAADDDPVPEEVRKLRRERDAELAARAGRRPARATKAVAEPAGLKPSALRGDADSLSPMSSVAEVQAAEASASIADEDQRTNLARFRFAMGGGLLVCMLFIAVDWLVVTFIEPGPLQRYLELRALIGIGLGGAFLATFRKPAISPATLKLLDLTVFSLVAAMITLMCVEFGGITSPYYAGVILVIVCRAAAMPTNWRAGLLYFGVPAALYPGILLALAPWDRAIAAQLHNTRDVALFGLNVIFVASALLLTIIGSHVVWALRQQLYASRNLGRYRLKQRIGAGGMGEVWRAHHAGLKRDVALKILRPERSGNQIGVARFEREVAATVRLTHPHTVRLFDHGVTADGLWYYAMELLDGEDLRVLVDRAGPLPPDRVVYLMTQAARALSEAHALSIIHRDIKPANLFVTHAGGEQDFLKVLDFGIAKIADGTTGQTLTNTGWLGGTPDYMSPELVLGKPADARTDVYSFGAVMYFLLTGQPPFNGASAAEVMNAHVNRPLTAPSHVAAHALPADVEAIVLRAMAKDPDDRYASAAELTSALVACDCEWQPQTTATS